MRFVVFDVESKDTVDFSCPERAGYSVVCAYSNVEGLSFYDEKNIERLGALLLRHDLLVGFGIDGYDIPVLSALSPHCKEAFAQVRTWDINTAIQQVKGHRCRLDDVARATVGRGKNGNGADAPRLWKEGKVAELYTYVTNDVRLETDLFQFVVRHGHVKTPRFNRRGGTEDVFLSLPWANALQ